MTLSQEEAFSLLLDQKWRMENLYKIKDKEGRVIDFQPNWAQNELYDSHKLTLVLKARQLGITTFHALKFLDLCLFQPNTNAAIVADNKDIAREIFTDKVKFAYDHLPQFVRDMCVAYRDNVNEMRFSNGSVFRVATSLRGGTLQYLHITEFAKVCMENPNKANEIITGALNAVQAGQFICIESTARGRDGHFYDLCKRAMALKDENKELTSLDWKITFFPWWKHPDYVLDSKNVLISNDMIEYFESLERKDIILSPEQKAWYVKKMQTQGEYMKREFPSCIAKDTQILTNQGIYKIQDVPVDGKYVLDKFFKGERDVYEVTTKLGYSFQCTLDHQILSDNKFKRLSDLSIGDNLVLSHGNFSNQLIKVSYDLEPFVQANIDITEDFARFLGYFMGDGCFNRDRISFACDAQDVDVVEDISNLIEKFTGKKSTRKICGSKKGCIEVGTSKVTYKNHFYALDIIRQNSSLSFKRNINIPWYIKQSPKSVVKEFLRGLFEADGFAQKNGSGVKFFSKHLSFIRDVQLLLLQFGITSRVSSHNKKTPNGNIYIGYELSLRSLECGIFIKEIGFCSKRKNDRLKKYKEKIQYNTCKINFLDSIVKINLIGKSEVWDLTTSDKQYSAGGVVVHNCPEEAFETANEGFYFSKMISEARQDKRICHVPYDDHAKTYTSWDIGYGDSNAIWVYQVVGKEVHCIDYYENSDEPLSHYVNWIRSKPYHIEKHFLPHDANSKSLQTGKSVADIARGMGLKVDIIPRDVNELYGIENLRGMLNRFFFDEVKCSKGIKAIENFRKEWNEKLGCYREKSYHDWASHGAKALIYCGQSLAKISSGYGMTGEDWDKMRKKWL